MKESARPLSKTRVCAAMRKAPMLKTKKKERRSLAVKLKVRVVGARPMTGDEERRFQAAVDALLSEVIRQELSREKRGGK